MVAWRWMGLAAVIAFAAPAAFGEPPANAPAKPETRTEAEPPPPGGAASGKGETTAPVAPTEKPRLALVGRTAENWIYIDKPTLRKLTNDKYELWAQVKQSGGDTVKMLLQLNCGGRSYLVKSSATYAEDGTVIDSYTPRSPSLQYIVPDSAAEYIHGAICK